MRQMDRTNWTTLTRSGAGGQGLGRSDRRAYTQLRGQPYTLTPKPETRNPKPETRNPEPETRNPKPETRNPEPQSVTRPFTNKWSDFGQKATAVRSNIRSFEVNPTPCALNPRTSLSP